MPFWVRRGTEADARAAANLWLRARMSSVDTIPAPVHDDEDVRAWFASHVVSETELWIATDSAGILVLEADWVDQLYVEPTMTGQGIGAQLLSLAKRGYPLRTRNRNEPAGSQCVQSRRTHDFSTVTRALGSLSPPGKRGSAPRGSVRRSNHANGAARPGPRAGPV
jgi:GNAT superfamily N-acetyltransferase